MALANEVSRVSWSQLLDSWSQSLVLLDAAAFSSLDRLPITRSRKVRCFAVFYGVLQCFERFRTSVRSSEALCSSQARVALKLLYWS